MSESAAIAPASRTRPFSGLTGGAPPGTASADRGLLLLAALGISRDARRRPGGDRSFIREPAAAGLSPLARGIVDLGRAMHLVMVAEGIEHVEQADALRRVGCELGQGFYLARPMKAAAFEKLIRSTPSVLPRPGATPP